MELLSVAKDIFGDEISDQEANLRSVAGPRMKRLFYIIHSVFEATNLAFLQPRNEIFQIPSNKILI